MNPNNSKLIQTMNAIANIQDKYRIPQTKMQNQPKYQGTKAASKNQHKFKKTKQMVPILN